MADMAAGRRGIDHHDIPWPDKTAENGLIGVGAADGSYFDMIAFKKDFQIDC